LVAVNTGVNRLIAASATAARIFDRRATALRTLLYHSGAELLTDWPGLFTAAGFQLGTVRDIQAQTLPAWQHVQAVYRQHAQQAHEQYGRRLGAGIERQVARAIRRCGSYPALSATAPSTPLVPARRTPRQREPCAGAAPVLPGPRRAAATTLRPRSPPLDFRRFRGCRVRVTRPVGAPRLIGAAIQSEAQMAAAMQPYWQWRAIIRGGNGHLAPLLVALPRQERGIRGLRLYRSFSSEMAGAA
jgi:hypothetical protein